ESGPKAGPLSGTRCGPANEDGRVRPSRSNNQRGDSVTRFVGTLLLTGFVACLGTPVRAEGGKDAGAVIDKAIKALGGADKLGAAKAFSWKSKGTLTFGGDDNKVSADTMVQGHDHYRTEVSGEIMGNPIMVCTVLAGDKGWRKFNDMVSEMDKD